MVILASFIHGVAGGLEIDPPIELLIQKIDQSKCVRHVKMACDCVGRPKCADGKKVWYEKMMNAKKMKSQVVKKESKPKPKKVKKIL